VGRGRGRSIRARRFLARRRDQQGTALVEAVIIIPVLMLITFGGIEFGIGFSQKGALESAARAGARLGSTQTKDGSTPSTTPTLIGDNVLGAVNNALGTTAAPELTKLYVYKAGTSLASCAASGTCIQYLPTPDKKQFDAATASGTWPYLDAASTPTRHGCVPLPGTPDKISVQIEGDFAFLTGLVGNGKIHLTVSSTLQFEPTDC
jgi:Flp pilus assembly protein TadG